MYKEYEIQVEDYEFNKSYHRFVDKNDLALWIKFVDSSKNIKLYILNWKDVQ